VAILLRQYCGARGASAMIFSRLDLSIVEFYSLTCTATCPQCASLSTEECGRDAFCTVTMGKRSIPGSPCLDPEMAVGCQDPPNGCIPEGSAFFEPQGEAPGGLLERRLRGRWAFAQGLGTSGDLSMSRGRSRDARALVTSSPAPIRGVP
jgi:hypothetical protein